MRPDVYVGKQQTVVQDKTAHTKQVYVVDQFQMAVQKGVTKKHHWLPGKELYFAKKAEKSRGTKLYEYSEVWSPLFQPWLNGEQGRRFQRWEVSVVPTLAQWGKSFFKTSTNWDQLFGVGFTKSAYTTSRARVSLSCFSLSVL